MAFNLFSAITSGMNAYNALSNTQTGQNMIGQVKQAIAPVTQPIQQAFNPAIQTAKSAIAPATNIMSSIAKPVVESTVFNKKTQDYYAPFKSEIEKIGITYDDLAELPEEEKQQVVSQLKQIGVQIPGLAEQEQAKAQEQAIQGEDLGVMGNINEALAGGVRVGEQIPRYAGNLLNLTQKYVTSPLISGGAEMLGSDEFANKWRTASTQFGEGAKALGEEITRAGEGNITEKQRTARRVGANIVATAPIPVKGLGLIKGTGILPTIGRGALAGAEATPISIGLEEGRLPTMGEQAIGTVGGAVLGTVAEKLAIPGIQKGIESVQKKINPSKFTKQIDDETINLVRKAVRPSITGVDSVGKFDIQDEKLLQGVKEVVKQGKKPKNSRELMESISDTKKSIWSEVEKSNKSVIKTTNGYEISTKIKGIVNDPEYDELFANNPSLEAELMRFADDVVTNKRFQNLSQEKLQNYLVDINGRIPQTAFQKSLASNPTQTAKDTLIAKVYKDILDDNLEVAVGMAGKETRQAYGAVRQLEKDFAKRYGVYLRQNPQGLADMFGMEGFADIAVGLLRGSPSQVVRGGIIQGVKKLIKAQNNPDTIIRDIFNLQGKLKNIKTPIIKKPQKLLAPPSKEAIIAESKKGLNKDIKRPLSITPEQAQLAKQAQRQAQVKEVERELNTALKSNYNPNKPVAVKEFIERNITQGKITREEAIPMVENLYENANGFDKPHYEKILNDLYSNKKIESFDDLINEKQVKTIVKTPRQEFIETPEGIYREINKKANDRRYNPEKANALIAKFKEKTGIDLMKDPLQKFDEKGNVIRTIVKPNSTTNAKQQVIKPASSDTIPEGYFKNAFGEIVKNPSNSKGGFIRNPFAKPEPKRLFAGENSAQPPKGKTGWFKGADGKMRFEIDDSIAKVKPINQYEAINGKTYQIPDILQHDELFKQYPKLKGYRVEFTTQEGTAGQIIKDPKDHAQMMIKLSKSLLSQDTKTLKSTLLHEIQHGIQDIEGFAKGGNITNFDKSTGKLAGNPELNKLFEEYRGLQLKLDKLDAGESVIMHKGQPYEYKLTKDAVKRQMDILDSKINEIEDNIKYKEGKQALEEYKKIAGEVEARNVQSRMNLTAKERTIKKPESTEDVPRAKQIIRMDSKGPAMSIKSPDSKLIEEARKYKSADEFISAHNKKDYRSAHQLNNADSVTADRIDLNRLKEAIRTRNGYLNNYVLKDLKKLEKLQNNPEGKVTIYRASPKNELNEGDWVTTDKSYAQYIKKQNGGQVNSFDVYVKDLRFPNDLENLPSLQMATTFNYGPNIDKLTQIYKQAHKTKSITK